MSKRPAKLRLVPRSSAQLKCINEKIAALAALKPYGDVYGALSLAAHLAGEAITAAAELAQMPGVDPSKFQPTAEFWHRVRDFTGTAALACAGGNQSLPEALVTFRLLRKCGGNR